jgi:hypothetical protein
MGGEKFHITVTIDNEKALKIGDFLAFAYQEVLASRDHPSRPKILIPRDIPIAILLSRSPIKHLVVVGLPSADICVNAVAL